MLPHILRPDVQILVVFRPNDAFPYLQIIAHFLRGLDKINVGIAFRSVKWTRKVRNRLKDRTCSHYFVFPKSRMTRVAIPYCRFRKFPITQLHTATSPQELSIFIIALDVLPGDRLPARPGNPVAALSSYLYELFFLLLWK